jgi:hypothetical protein
VSVKVGDVVRVTHFLRGEEPSLIRQWLRTHTTTVVRMYSADDMDVAVPRDLGAWGCDASPTGRSWTVAAVRPASPEEVAAYRLAQLTENGL